MPFSRLLLFAMVLAASFIAGCTERERAGYSSIPQSTPPEWRLRPFGEIRN